MILDGWRMAAGRKTGGRQRGVPNKTTALVKDMITQALEHAGGVEYLIAQARDNPNAFLTLVGKVVPLQVNADVNAKLVGEVVFRGLNG